MRRTRVHVTRARLCPGGVPQGQSVPSRGEMVRGLLCSRPPLVVSLSLTLDSVQDGPLQSPLRGGWE